SRVDDAGRNQQRFDLQSLESRVHRLPALAAVAGPKHTAAERPRVHGAVGTGRQTQNERIGQAFVHRSPNPSAIIAAENAHAKGPGEHGFLADRGHRLNAHRGRGRLSRSADLPSLRRLRSMKTSHMHGPLILGPHRTDGDTGQQADAQCDRTDHTTTPTVAHHLIHHRTRCPAVPIGTAASTGAGPSAAGVRPNNLAPTIPTSYNTISGTAINNMVNRVASGVTTADKISATITACFR